MPAQAYNEIEGGLSTSDAICSFRRFCRGQHVLLASFRYGSQLTDNGEEDEWRQQTSYRRLRVSWQFSSLGHPL